MEVCTGEVGWKLGLHLARSQLCSHCMHLVTNLLPTLVSFDPHDAVEQACSPS